MLEGKQRRATRSARQPSYGRESGQALLELALVTPVLVILIMAIFQFAMVLESQIGLQNAVREAARRAATAGTDNRNLDVSNWSWVVAQLDGTAGPPVVTGLLKDNIQAYNPSRRTVTGGFCTYQVDGLTNYRVDVTVQYNHPVFFGWLSFATDVMDGTSDGNWTLAATTQMRVETPISGTIAVCPALSP